MGRILLVMVLGAALFLSGAWYLGLLKEVIDSPTPLEKAKALPVAKLEDLKGDLYVARPFPSIPKPAPSLGDPTAISGALVPFELEEVSSQVPGRILFIGEQVDESAVAIGGSAVFLAEPYSPATIKMGAKEKDIVKFYRRLYEGDTVRKDQILAMIEPAKAMGEVLSRVAKVGVAVQDLRGAEASEKEGDERWERAFNLYHKVPPAIAKEEYGAAVLTRIKLRSDRVSAEKKITVAEVEKDQADIELDFYSLRSKLSYEKYTVKNIVRQAGYAVKPGDPIMVVQSLERLMAEALIEEQYYTRLKDKTHVTATIEPTVIEAPLHEFPGHALDVTSVAVARDMRIVSGSEDQYVCVWKIGTTAPLKRLEHEAAVRVIACTPDSKGTNLCLSGCDNGSIYLWDLDSDDAKPLKLIEKEQAHGNDASITALAFSPDGKFFASGASDGTIRIWSADGAHKYAFIPENGVAQAHENAVTSLHFTPQSRLVSAGNDKTLRVWKLKELGAAPDGKALRDRDGNVGRLGVSHDGKWMLFDQAQAHTLKLLSVEDHILKHTINLPINAQPFETFALFSPDDKLILTGGAPENRLQLWRTPDAGSRTFEVRQFATRERKSVSCAAFSPEAGKGGAEARAMGSAPEGVMGAVSAAALNSLTFRFAVSGSGHKVYVWSIPTEDDVDNHLIKNVRLTLKTHSLDSSTRQARIGFEIPNPPTLEHPNGRFEAGRPVRIVID